MKKLTIKNILVPIDFSTHAEHALDYACELAKKLDATVHLVNAIGAAIPELTVTLTGSMFETLRRNNTASLERLAEPRRGIATIGKLVVTDGEARDGILAAALEVHADMIVMGTHGSRGIARAVRGSVAEDIIRRAACPVLTVRVTSHHHSPEHYPSHA